jgi:alkylation response protein AidB-like acyl-CoA dehydrogenase
MAFEFSDEHKMARRLLRQWVEAELAPAADLIESGALLPYDLTRKLLRTFGVAAFAEDAFAVAEDGAARDEGEQITGEPPPGPARMLVMGDAAFTAVLTIELSRVSPGFALSVGATIGACARTIMRRGTRDQKLRFALPLLTGEKIGAWAVTEPGAGSDAFGGMRMTARKVDGGFVLSGQKTFITNAPYADVLIVYAKLHDGDVPLRDRPIQAFLLEKGMQGLTVSAPMKKMGMGASPTGEIFLDEVFVADAGVLGAQVENTSREEVRDFFHVERTAVVAMAYGIIERCLETALAYARERRTWQQPIGDYQLIQAKLARMYIHFQNVRGLLFRDLWMSERGIRMTLGEASAMKAYAAPAATECALEAIQILGGNGYMRDYRVEQLARDAKALQIGGGTDEIQLVTCARALLRGDTVL